VRMGLAHRHDRQTSHVMVVALGCHPSDPHRWPRVRRPRAPPSGQEGGAER
jgi:hypothetical protein